jgi:hypothetical protein
MKSISIQLHTINIFDIVVEKWYFKTPQYSLSEKSIGMLKSYDISMASNILPALCLCKSFRVGHNIPRWALTGNKK